eukprot:4912891-Pyramimonas_sp.AAC.1
MLAAPGAPGAGRAAWPPGVAEWNARGPGHADVVAASLTNDDGEEARRWAEFVVLVEAEIAIADAPGPADLGPALRRLRG